MKTFVEILNEKVIKKKPLGNPIVAKQIEDMKKIQKMFKKHGFKMSGKGQKFAKEFKNGGVVDGYINLDKKIVDFAIRGYGSYDIPLMNDPLFTKAEDNIPKVNIDDLKGLEKILKIIDKYE